MSNLSKVREDIQAMNARAERLEKENGELRTQLKAMAEPRVDATRVLGDGSAPYVTTGPVGQDSRGFRLTKALAAVRGIIPRDEAKPELDACERFEKALKETGMMPAVREHGTIMVPLSMSMLTEETAAHEGGRYMKAMWAAGADGYDPGEGEWLARRLMKSFGPGHVVYKTAMSYLQDNIGGTLVAPPVQGELIELVRPRECLMAAGASSVPLPPNGRMVFPRQTGPTTFYWVGENTGVTESNPTTGQVVMQAKKGGVLVLVPNELLRFASVAADALIRTDTAKSIALGIDNAGLYGVGGSSQPKGLTLYSGSNEVIAYHSASPTPLGVGTDGNTLRPEDGYRMVGLVEDRNFEFKSWIFRPTLANNIMGYRSDGVVPGDAAGGFVQSLMRMVGDRVPSDKYCGYPVVKSAVVKNNLTKGSGTSLTEVFGGQWEHLMVGTYGAVEFATSNQAGSAFAQDQTYIRALVWTDIVPRYEGAFCWYSLLLNQLN